VEATVPNVADTDQRSAGSASLLATGKEVEVEATVPNVADTDQRSAGSASLLATGKRLRESFTTHEENMDADSSPVARKIRVNTARAASAMPKKGI
jgi:predicted regulator of Ras-like GTPase activity (Roadblock/LC7/MglB family)